MSLPNNLPGRGEQIDILRGTVDHTVLTDGAGTRQGETEPGNARQGDTGHLTLRITLLTHAPALSRSRGKRVSHNSRARRGRSSSGHTSTRRSRLRMAA